MRQKIHHIALMFATGIFVVGAMASTLTQQPGIKELAGNEEYMSLIAQNEELKEQEDSIIGLISEARNAYTEARNTATLTPEEIDKFDSHIIDLEQQVFEIRTRRGSITSRLNAIEQEWVLAQLTIAPSDTKSEIADVTPTVDPEADIKEVVDSKEPTDSEDSTAQNIIPIEPQRTTLRNLIDNECFATELAEYDYNDLRQAQREESELQSLAKRYATLYNEASSLVSDYLATNNEAEAVDIYDRFTELTSSLYDTSAEIDQKWNHVLDTKYYAYGYILEKSYNYDLLDKASADFSTMQQQCAANDGIYASDALMHYAMGRATLINHEREFARQMELHEAADSLDEVYRTLTTPEYRLEPLRLEKRLFLDYSPITIGRTNYYSSTNPVPELKVYDKGTIYRLLLGSFRSKQPMTLFKGVQPLSIAQDEEGTYLYYAGGYATKREADEAEQFLREKGFKAPEVCCWKDGVMTNLSDEDTNEEQPTIIVGNRYMVQIDTESISDDMRATITQVAPAKMISRAGSKFAVGVFNNRSEADLLVTTLAELYPDTAVEITEIEIN